MIDEVLEEALQNLNARGWDVFRAYEEDMYRILSHDPVSRLDPGRYVLFPHMKGERTVEAIDSVMDYLDQTFLYPIATSDDENQNLGYFTVSHIGVELEREERITHHLFAELTGRITPYRRMSVEEMQKPKIIDYPVNMPMPMKKNWSGLGVLVHGVYFVPSKQSVPPVDFLFELMAPAFSLFPKGLVNLKSNFEVGRYRGAILSASLAFDLPIGRDGNLAYLTVIGEDRKAARDLFDLIYLTATQNTMFTPTAISHQLPKNMAKLHIMNHFNFVQSYLPLQN